MTTEILLGNCFETLKTLESNSVNCCVTSPPYYGLRDYGMEEQIGLEESPEEYVSKLVNVFREVRRVLRDDGTLWLNIGDSYVSGGETGYRGHGYGEDKKYNEKRMTIGAVAGLASKNLIGIPWRLAFALQSDGWILRQDIIWHKPNCMPESVTDRCTKSHEYMFLLSKKKSYYYDIESIKEPISESTIIRYKYGWNGNKHRDVPGGHHNNFDKYMGSEDAKEATHRNKRSVWEVPTKASGIQHFATFPEDLISPCILAGCPENGTVLDPFGGAGTTAVVAQKMNRNAILCELNPKYRDLALERIRNVDKLKDMFE